MAVSVVTKVRIGFSLALVGLIAIGGAVAFVYSNPLRAHRTGICCSFGLLGLLMWIAGRLQVRPATETHSDPGCALKQAAENPLAFLKTVKHWGIILVLSTGVVYSHGIYRSLQAAPRLPQPRPEITMPPPPVVFPPLQLQGIILQGVRSSALINGRVLFIGEDISGVQLVAIDSEHVTVAMEGQTNLLTLRR